MVMTIEFVVLAVTASPGCGTLCAHALVSKTTPPATSSERATTVTGLDDARIPRLHFFIELRLLIAPQL
jgi:hypothetical protein